MKEKIIDLMKEKFSTMSTKSHKKLNITPKDNLYSAYKKLALYLYENSSLAEQDEINVIADETKNRINLPVTNFQHIEKMEISNQDLLTVERYLKDTNAAKKDEWYKHIYFSNQLPSDNKKNIESICIVLSPSGAFKNSALNSWFYRFNRENHKKKALMLINLPLSYSYGLIKDELNNYLPSSQKDNGMMQRIIRNLCSQTGSKSKFDKDFPSIPNIVERKQYMKNIDISECTLSDFGNNYYILPKNSYVLGTWYSYDFNGSFRPILAENSSGFLIDDMVEVTLPNEDRRIFMHKDELDIQVSKQVSMNYAQKYLTHVKNIMIQFEYDYAQKETVSKARFFEQKKNINKSTLTAMTRLKHTLNDRFRDVEIDNDVDLDKLAEITEELKKTSLLLPKVEGVKPILRFRKLRNLHALGAYFNLNQTIAVDFRSANAGKEKNGIGAINVGLQSFIHEYGHFIDYNFADEQLSLKTDFELILQSAQNYIFSKGEGFLSSSKQNYFATPTEVFARAFEFYVSNCNLDNDFIKDTEQYQNSQNLAFSCFSNVKSDLINYFDNLLPNLKDKILEYNFEKEKKTNPINNEVNMSEKNTLIVNKLSADNGDPTTSKLNNKSENIRQMSLF